MQLLVFSTKFWLKAVQVEWNCAAARWLFVGVLLCGANWSPVALAWPPSSKDAKTVDDFIRDLYKIRNPQTALQAIADYEASHELTAAHQKSLKIQRERFLEIQKTGLVKLGVKWVTPAELKDAVDKSNAEIELAREALSKGDGKSTLRHLTKASSLNPNGYEADFFLAMLFSINGNCNPAIAEKHFQSVLTLSPDYIPALNNLALTEVKLRKFNEAFSHFKQAARISPNDPDVAHNLERIVREGTRGTLPVPKKKDPGRSAKTRLELFSELLDDVRKASEPDGHKPRIGTGWLYSPLVKTEGERVDEDRKEEDASKSNSGDVRKAATTNARPLVAAGSGTGFAVAPTILVTNRHVVRDDQLGLADAVTVQALGVPGAPKLTGKVLAVSDTVDLALIEIAGMNATPIGFSTSQISRGTEVAVFGFPRGLNLGASLKMTRGIVTALPDAKFEGMFFLDAEANPGNSGGPVCDARGHILGVLTKVTLEHVGDYSLAIPADVARNFATTKVTDLTGADAAAMELPWNRVDQMVSGSVFFVEVLYRSSPLRLAESLPEKIRPTRHELEDVSCCTCNGLGAVRCTAVGCALGGVTTMEWYVTTVDLGEYAGKVSSVNSSAKKSKCQVCDGRGRLRCQSCSGKGINSDIR